MIAWQLSKVRWVALLIGGWVALACGDGRGASPEPTHQELLFFEQKVRPILATRCYRCHGANQQKGELRLDSRHGMLTGGELGAAVELEVPDESILLDAIRYENSDLQMPPDGRLPESDIIAIRQWLQMGAPWPASETPPTSAQPADEVAATATDHWSFQPIRSPPVPTNANTAWVENNFDNFVLRRIVDAELTPSPAASPRQLVRRLYFDLIGLPPTADQVAAFVADESPDAYQRLVERLLAMPQYGERWGRHWLDVVRYAETNGIAGDNNKPNAWRYRDYVIKAWNNDTPFDRFLTEQLAGDELSQPTPDSIVATGFYRLALYQKLGEKRQLKLKRLEKFVQLDDIARAISEGMLGVTIGCARCHDHKFDPVSQQDYYSLLAFLNNIVPIDMDKPVPLVDIDRYQREHDQQKEIRERLSELHKRATELQADASDKLIRQQLGGEVWERYQIAKKLDFRKRSVDQRHLFERVENELTPDLDEIHFALRNDERWHVLQVEVRELEQRKFPEALTVREFGAAAEPMYLLVRGDIDSPREHCPPQFPHMLDFEVNAERPLQPCDEFAATLQKTRGETSGLRTRLARWVTDPRNPLTARVIVNRIVQHHFGRGLVRTPNDFGSMGTPPTHPDLLDWLATRFVEQQWSVKQLQRIILMSSTYRQSSQPQDLSSEQQDPNNDLLRRQNLRRLEAEVIRDSVLAVSGQLNPRIGGPSYYPAMPREMITLAKGKWGRSGRANRSRRAVYTFVKRTLKDPFLELFDYNNVDQSVGQRNVSTVAPQALTLLNSSFMQQQAAALADRLLAPPEQDTTKIVENAFLIALQRSPTARESTDCSTLFATDTSRRDATEALALIVMNLNEFVYID